MADAIRAACLDGTKPEAVEQSLKTMRVAALIPSTLRGEPYIRAYTQRINQVERLEDEANAPAPKSVSRMAVQLPRIDAFDDDRATLRRANSRDGHERGRLATTRRTDDGHRLTGTGAKIGQFGKFLAIASENDIRGRQYGWRSRASIHVRTFIDVMTFAPYT
ncbi:MAG: hypothetical protein WCA78_14525 [Rhizomicrobium sp.]